ncbi:MAG: GMP synthase - Glutamine amidotransferase domain [Algoriphagus marincola HL-49]|uniref:GMP synthase-Glutamine amidotransferase domain n=1 Tax=Algoriphagus marincola HL-49 TaxID=1305737 RepID=A0A0P7YSR0_9BACT|nr:MAG: GMP synthase - Glutamine amidotransferase domain [Algoriphagus marincola HL-49]
MEKSKINLAILDMYDGEPNQGMRCIQEIVGRFQKHISFRVFDVRGKSEVPDVQDFDLFISTGGPGSPLEGNGEWELKYFDFLDQVWIWNQNHNQKKFLLLICHSFQMACKHFGLGDINKRKSTSFGVMTIHKTEEGLLDPLFYNLDNPFWAVDSRDYQVICPEKRKFKQLGAKIIALEKIRNHVEYERALMGIRFSDEIVGTQFHPEADAISFLEHLKKPEVKEKIIAVKGKTKFRDMIEHLVDEDKIVRTNQVLIPNFLERGIKAIATYRKKKILI